MIESPTRSQTKVKSGKKNDNTHILGVFIEARVDELLESLGVVASELGGVVLGDEEEHAHGVQVTVGGLPFGQLYCCDAQGPDIRLG